MRVSVYLRLASNDVQIKARLSVLRDKHVTRHRHEAQQQYWHEEHRQRVSVNRAPDRPELNTDTLWSLHCTHKITTHGENTRR